MTVLMQLSVPATGARAPGCAAGRNNAAAAQWAVWAPAAQQGPTVMLPTPAAAASCTAAVAHAGTDATHRGSNCCNSTAAHCTIPWPAGTAAAAWMQLLRRRRPAQEHPAAQPAATSAAQWAVWAPAAQQGPTVMLPTPAAAASCTAAVAHAGTDATHRGSNRRKSTRLHSRLQQRSCSSVGSVGAWGPAGPTVMLPTPAAAASCTAAVAHAGTDATHRGSNWRKSTRLHSRSQQRSCSSVGSVGAGGPAGTDRDAADACRSGIMHRGSRNDGTDATHRASNRRKSTRLRSRSQQRSCSSVGSVGAGGPAGTDRDAADACRSGVMHRGSRTCRYRCNSPWQQLLQQHGRALHYPLAGRDRCSGMDATSAPPQASARAPGCTAGRNQCSSVGSVGAGGPAGTDRDAADACRSGIMHRGSRTCRYRCNSPWQQPAQEHTAAQPAATTQLQLSGQCGRLGPSRTDRDAADACRSGVMHRGSRNDGTDATLRASNWRKSTRLRSRSQQRSCSSVGSVGAGGPAGTDRDAADACRSGIMHRGSRTCRYRCNSPWQQPAQEHTAAQPAATTQLQLSGQCGRLGPSRTDRDAADACRSGIIAPRQSQ